LILTAAFTHSNDNYKLPNNCTGILYRFTDWLNKKQMKHLNDTNGASTHTLEIAERCLNEFETLTGVEMGIAYGGGVEAIGKLWKDKGVIYGMDTFEGHPQEIAEICEITKQSGGKDSFAARCMDGWYQSSEYGTEAFKLDYIQSELDKQGLDNVKLVKGLITDKTKLPFKELNYCFIDLDYPLSQIQAYELVKKLIVKGGYLLLHDMIPKGHITGNFEYYQKILKEGLFEVVKEVPESYLCILKKV
jgi:hypothetical protein